MPNTNGRVIYIHNATHAKLVKIRDHMESIAEEQCRKHGIVIPAGGDAPLWKAVNVLCDLYLADLDREAKEKEQPCPRPKRRS